MNSEAKRDFANIAGLCNAYIFHEEKLAEIKNQINELDFSEILFIDNENLADNIEYYFEEKARIGRTLRELQSKEREEYKELSKLRELLVKETMSYKDIQFKAPGYSFCNTSKGAFEIISPYAKKEAKLSKGQLAAYDQLIEAEEVYKLYFHNESPAKPLDLIMLSILIENKS